MSPTLAAADLFSARVKEGYGTPANALGSEAPMDGENYAVFLYFQLWRQRTQKLYFSKIESSFDKRC